VIAAAPDQISAVGFHHSAALFALAQRLWCKLSERLPDYRVCRLLAIAFFAEIVFAQIVVLASLDP
jgi:hypothetical protein